MAAFGPENIRSRSIDELRDYYTKQKLTKDSLDDPRSKKGEWATREMNKVKAEILRRGLSLDDVVGNIDRSLPTDPKPDFRAIPTPPPAPVEVHTQETRRPARIVYEFTLREAYKIVTEMKMLAIPSESETYTFLQELEEKVDSTMAELSGEPVSVKESVSA